ncbi:MAG: DUF1003 domain-containing protein [Bacteroidales bacterium]|nr:DUF1003 domain-containing protein [Bacteroidales bacterium]TFH48057.1 MAG: DUF1003 domain-containing protein [Bacteroidia bacterium]
MKHQNLLSLQEIKTRYKAIRNVNIQHKENLSAIDKVSLWITEHVGSMGFFFAIFMWTLLWLSWNTLAPAHLRFDPFPAFVLWLFISNMIQIFLMPLIMIGQNLQSKHSEVRAEEDYKINIKAETEIETILMHLENQNELIQKILEKIKESGK